MKGSVKITEKYTRVSLRRLEQDFPSLAVGYNHKEDKNSFGDTDSWDTVNREEVFTDREKDIVSAK